MFSVREMSKNDYTQVLKMVDEFYNSNAVLHKVPQKVMESTLSDAISGDKNLVGYCLLEDDLLIGFAYITFFYACEIGGLCLMIEEIYLSNLARGKGYGTKFFQFLYEKYDSKVSRYRLEVTPDNDGAQKLYGKLGFEPLGYNQMIRDL